ncbi:MAG: glycosyltransferase [Eubacteriales bacterium]
MKVMQINSVCGKGSTGKIAVDICDILTQEAVECRIAYGRDQASGIDSQSTMRVGTELDVKVHGLMTRITDRTGFYSRTATNQLIAKIEAYNPDVIHLHNIHGYYINIEILFKYMARTNKKVIWTLHDCWAFTGHCAYFDMVGCEKWKTGCYQCVQKKSYPQSLVLDNSRRNYRDKKQLFTAIKDMTIITPSKWLANLVKESYLGKYPVKVIHNGIDLEKFHPVKSDYKIRNAMEDKHMILGVSNIWEERKGLKDLLELQKLLPNHYQIVLVGLSQEQVDSLPEGMIGMTRTSSQEELIELYSEADVFVNPTYEDNFPTTNIEALACGTPVITYNTGGSPEAVDETCGIVVAQGDIEALSEQIQKIIGYKVKHQLKDSTKDEDGRCDMDVYSQEACVIRSKQFDKQSRYMDYLAEYSETKQ